MGLRALLRRLRPRREKRVTLGEAKRDPEYRGMLQQVAKTASKQGDPNRRMTE